MKQTEWCGVRIIINDATSDLFQMSEPDENPNQQPEFHITQSTADIVPLDFNRYQPSLQRMIENWREEKESLMRQKKRPATEAR
jgi:phage regulator Rha-like protein